MAWEGNHADRDASASGDRFPWLVTIASLVIALWIVFSSTASAREESEMLDREAEALQHRRDRLLEAAGKLRDRRAELPHNPDFMIVEFDRQGLLPEEAVEQFLPPERLEVDQR